VTPIAELAPGTAREVPATGQPAVLRGLANDWPAVAAAKEGVDTLAKYLARFA